MIQEVCQEPNVLLSAICQPFAIRHRVSLAFRPNVYLQHRTLRPRKSFACRFVSVEDFGDWIYWLAGDAIWLVKLGQPILCSTASHRTQSRVQIIQLRFTHWGTRPDSGTTRIPPRQFNLGHNISNCHHCNQNHHRLSSVLILPQSILRCCITRLTFAFHGSFDI